MVMEYSLVDLIRHVIQVGTMIRFLVKSLDEEILQISGSLNPPHTGSLFMIFCSSQSLAARNGTSPFPYFATTRNLEISLDQKTGSELVSSNIFLHGYFSASIKLPRSQGTVGVVVAFDSMNQDRYSKNQDEVTFEILGNVKGKEWAVQTNVHGNTTIRNSTSKGREERYTLRFDPSADFHKYSIFWTENHIIFYVDDVPIRLFMRIKAIGNYFIASPMYVHGSIWDTSDWTTDGGKQKVDYRYGPFTATSS
uniref:GH16 domain-containing protein n=1 Tax=Vitis vinifera TaxID=29760 RepID=F6HP82_VITVI